MKQFIYSILVSVGVLACNSCDRHAWENSAEGVKDGTKNLFHAEDILEHGHGHDDAVDDSSDH